MKLRDFIARLQALPEEAQEAEVALADWAECYASPSGKVLHVEYHPNGYPFYPDDNSRTVTLVGDRPVVVIGGWDD